MSRSYVPKALRALVARQARYRCGYCLSQESIVGTPMEIEHIVPEALGGLTIEDNLWLACSLCNDHKGDRIAALDPLTGEIVRLFDPRHQAWMDHFAWTDEGTSIVGLTMVGRATIVALSPQSPIFGRCSSGLGRRRVASARRLSQHTMMLIDRR